MAHFTQFFPRRSQSIYVVLLFIVPLTLKREKQASIVVLYEKGKYVRVQSIEVL